MSIVSSKEIREVRPLLYLGTRNIFSCAQMCPVCPLLEDMVGSIVGGLNP